MSAVELNTNSTGNRRRRAKAAGNRQDAHARHFAQVLLHLGQNFKTDRSRSFQGLVTMPEKPPVGKVI